MDQEYKKRKRPLPIIENEVKPSLEEIESFEKTKNIVLPTDFKEFLLKYGECKIGYHLYDYRDIDDILYFSIEDTLGINVNNCELYSEKEIEYEGLDIDFPELFKDLNLIEIAYADGHAEICMSLVEKHRGEIYYIYDGSPDMTYKVADSFTEFLNTSTSPYDNEFTEACELGDEKGAIDIINKGFDLKTKDESNHSLLLSAIYSDYDMTNLIKLLVNKGINLDQSVYAASRKGNIETIKFLLDNNAPIGDASAIMTASRNGRLDIVELLIKYGADPIK